MTEKNKVIVLCDFDGTITTSNTLDMIYERHADCGTAYIDEWNAGRLSTQEEMRLTFDQIHATREEIEDSVDRYMQFDEGAAEFLALVPEMGYEFAIISEGFEWYIRYLLKKLGVPAPTIYASNIYFEADGSYRLDFPWYDPKYPMRGTAKATIVERYQREGWYTIFIGDGHSDTHAVEVADRVYAKQPLFDLCVAAGIPAIGIQSLSEVAAAWRSKPPV